MRKKSIIITAVIAAAAIIAAISYNTATEESAPAIASTFAVKGIDISAHNGDIDFKAVKEAGYDFAIIKASEGGDFKDSRFYANISRAKLAGLKVTAYHFFRFDTDGYAQGLNFIHSIRGIPLDMPAVIDIEQWSNPNNRSTDQIVKRLATMINHMERHGYKVMIYTNKDGYEQFIRGRFGTYPIWICSFTDIRPTLSGWTLWQYTHRGRIPGIAERVDINVFNGTENEWNEWTANTALDLQ